MAVLLEKRGLGQLLSFKEVSVIQSIDVQALQKLLAGLSEGQAAANAQIERQQQDIDALKADRQQQQQAQSQSHQHGGTEAAAASSIHSSTSSFKPAPSAAAQDAPHDNTITKIQDQLANMDGRLQHLEAHMVPDCFAPAPTAATPAAEPTPATHPPQASIAEPPAQPNNAALPHLHHQQQQADTAAGLHELRQQQALLASQLAALRASLAAAVSDCSQQLEVGLAGKADAALLQGLAQNLGSKAEGGELQQLRQQLAGKAGRAELDALLDGMADAGSRAAGVELSGAGGSSSGGGAAGGAAAGGAGAGAGAGGEVGRAEPSRLQLQLTLLQERITIKDDTAAVIGVAGGLAAVRQELVQLQLSTQTILGQLAAAQKALDDLRQAHMLQSQQQQQQQQHTAPASMQSLTSSAPRAAGIDSDLATQLQQLPLLLQRLSAVEESLAAAAAPQPGVAATTNNSGSNGDRSIGSVRLNTSGGEGCDTFVADLAAQVADLQAQIPQLMQAHGRTSCSSNRLEADMAASSDETTRAVPARDDSYATKEGANSGSDVNEAAAVTETGLDELAERVDEIQGALDGLAAAKADRGELERLRGLLAETAAQSDMELLRHKLDSQQQHLARLTQQLAYSGTGANAGSPCPPASSSSSTGSTAAACNSSLKTPKGLSRAGAEAAAGLASEEAGAVAAGASSDDVDGSELGMRQQQGGCGDEQLGSVELQRVDQKQLAGLELLAEAVGLLAVGQAGSGESAAGAAAASPLPPGPGHGSSGFSFSGSAAAGDGSGGLEGLASPGPQLLRLRRLLQTGQVGRKLDWFDPVLLQKMAQRLAAAEALIKLQPHAGSAGGAAAGPPADVEGRLKRLAADVRQLKERLGDVSAAATAGGSSRPPGQGGWGVRDGDHTMLAAKPLAGYRCMACDRPLGPLDVSPGPYLPTGLLPVSLQNAAELAAAAGAALGKVCCRVAVRACECEGGHVQHQLPHKAGGSGQLSPAGTGSCRTTVQEAGSMPPSAAAGDLPNLSLAGSPEPAVPGRRVTGPQSWYAQAHGLPAEQLPKGDVGPQLPPGGWRGSLPRPEDGSVLPVLVVRARGGGGGGGGDGGQPRTQGGRSICQL